MRASETESYSSSHMSYQNPKAQVWACADKERLGSPPFDWSSKYNVNLSLSVVEVPKMELNDIRLTSRSTVVVL